MLKLVSATFNANKGVVIIAGDNQEEVISPAARRMAVEAAAGHLTRPGTSGQESPYPVDEDGKTSEELILGRGDKKIAGYRCDFNISGAP